MLRVAEQWYGSDVGRQRQGNEDNFFVQSPLFVVADGMGGAQAGEVASEMAVESFRSGLPNGSPEEGLVSVIRDANHRIHDLSRTDSQRQGMGTTCTAAYVAEDEVVLAHVGDSRAYLFRGGDLTKLTRDHSLVGELVDRGKLTEEQAEVHPQRSVITRALGPESDVLVDTERIEARSGDVYLLCSDGLTSMIREHTIKPIMVEGGPLEEVGRKLIAAANDAGGRDNITVVLFRLEEVDVAGADAQPTTETAPVMATRTEEEAGAAGDATEAEYRAHGTVALSAIQAQEVRSAQAPEPDVAERAAPEPEPEPPPPSAPPPRTAPPPRREGKPKKRRRVPGPLVFVVIGILIIGIAAFFAIRGVFFDGLDQHSAVTIFRGVPVELPGGLDLYSRHYVSGVTIDDVPATRRKTFTDHKLRSLQDASDLVRALETGRIRG